MADSFPLRRDFPFLSRALISANTSTLTQFQLIFNNPLKTYGNKTYGNTMEDPSF